MSRAAARGAPRDAMRARFVEEYLCTFNAKEAAAAAGYKQPRVLGSKLLNDPDIRRELARRQKEQLHKIGLTAENVLEEIRRVAFLDPAEFWDEHGNLRPIRELSREVRAALGSFEVIIKNAKAGDHMTDTVHKVRFADKLKALELLAKHFALLTEQIVHSGKVAYTWMSEPD